MSVLYYETSNSLTHHGIKGQKWGVRRYQNPDGTLTAKGKKRYADDADDADDIILKDRDSIGKAANASIKKSYETLSTFKERMGEIGKHSSKYLDEHDKDYDELTNRYYKELDDLFGDDDVGRLVMSDYDIERLGYSLSKQQKQTIIDKYHTKFKAIEDRHRLESAALKGKYTVENYLTSQLKDIGVKDIDRGLKTLRDLDIDDLDELAQEYW